MPLCWQKRLHVALGHAASHDRASRRSVAWQEEITNTTVEWVTTSHATRELLMTEIKTAQDWNMGGLREFITCCTTRQVTDGER